MGSGLVGRKCAKVGKKRVEVGREWRKMGLKWGLGGGCARVGDGDKMWITCG